jgi:hypothetical protein
MPNSDYTNKPWAASVIQKMQPATAIDFGAGEGIYGQIIKKYSPETYTVGVEVWAPYVTQYQLDKTYDEVWVCDARIYPHFKYDLVIFGDILEHMTKEDAVALWERVSKEAKYAIISMPIVEFPQGHVHGNPFEEHVKNNWTHEEILETFGGIVAHETFEITGIYLAKF